jgi:hypothetical protein
MKTVMRCESPIAFDILGSRVPGRRQAPSCLPPLARSWSLSLERPTVDLSSIRQSSGPSKYIDRLALTSSSTSSCATTARTLRRNNHHSTIASPHIHAQPRASSRSRSQAARRAAASLAESLSLLLSQTQHRTLQVQRCVHLPCPAIIPSSGTHTAHFPVCWRLASSLARSASTVSSSRTHARDLAPTSAWLASPESPASIHRLRSPFTSVLPPRELSNCSRATPSDVD